jgi:hypothetical protein
MVRKYFKYINIEKNKTNSLCDLNTTLKINLKNNFKIEDKNNISLLLNKFRIKETRDLINIA